MTLFFRLLVIAVINAIVILRMRIYKVVIQKRRMYLRELDIELTKEYVKRITTMVILRRKLKRNIRNHLNVTKKFAAKERRQSKIRNICGTLTAFLYN